MFTKKSDRGLVWLAAGLLSLTLSSSAFALDHGREIHRAEDSAAQVLSTLGRDKRVGAMTSKDTASKVGLRLLPARKARRLR